MKIEINLNGTMYIKIDPLYRDTDGYTLMKWCKDWEKGTSNICIDYGEGHSKEFLMAITPNNSETRKDETGN